MSENLTYTQALYAMRWFLDFYYERTKSDDIGSLLGDLQLFPEGGTWDPAAWEDWMDSIKDVLGEQKKSNQSLSYLEAFKSMRRFLELYYARTNSSSIDIATILSDTEISSDESDSATWKIWMKCVDSVLAGNII